MTHRHDIATYQREGASRGKITGAKQLKTEAGAGDVAVAKGMRDHSLCWLPFVEIWDVIISYRSVSAGMEPRT